MVLNTLNFKLLPENRLKIEARAFIDSPIIIAAQTIQKTGLFARFKHWIKDLIQGKEFIKLTVKDGEILVRTEDLANQLGISKRRVLESESTGNLNHLIETAAEARHYKIAFDTIEQYEKRGEFHELHYLEYLSDTLEVPLAEILEANSKETLSKLFKNIDDVRLKCATCFKKLDELYKKNEGKIATKDKDERVVIKMEPKTLALIKKTVMSAYRAFISGAKAKSNVREVLSAGSDHRILVDSSGDNFKVTGLFGKVLGSGGAGVAIHTVNLLSGEWNKGDEAVLKIPYASDSGSMQALQEAEVLNEIHKDGRVLGIQKPLSIVRNVFTGKAAHCHLGALYQWDLFDIILHPETKNAHSLTLNERTSISYQLLHGLYCMHEQDLTHGDIKPEKYLL